MFVGLPLLVFPTTIHAQGSPPAQQELPSQLGSPLGRPRPPVGAPPLAQPNAQGATLLQQALSAVGAQTPVTDVTLTGNITVFIPGGTTDTGAITMLAKGDTQAEVTMKMATGTRTEVRSVSADGSPAEMRTGPDGAVTHNPVRSLLTPHPAWFFPQYVLAAQPVANIASSFVASETRGGVAVNHLQVWQLPMNSSRSARAVQYDTQYDLYLDPATSLPVAMVYLVQPDYPNRNPLVHRDTRAPVEMRFSDYQKVQGVPVAYHIQAFIQGRQIYDIQLSSAAFDTGTVIPVVN